MILGHGVDIVNINRVDGVYKKFGERFLKKILSDPEIKQIQDKSDVISFLAKHWAVKEAVSKSVGCGLINGSPLHFRDIILSKTSLNMPIIKPTKKLLNIIAQIYSFNLDDMQKISFHVSTSDDAGIIIASVILEINA